MIDILMATYNGEKYIEEQILSIINQSYKNWRLIISDDCSSDDTVKIIEKYQDKYPNRIVLHVNDQPSGSAKDNFYKLMTYSDKQYIMFSDQDDIWLENKVFKILQKMRELELFYGNKMPLLVHTDLCVVDENLNIINQSLFKFQHMDASRDNLNNLLVENVVTGCTVMVNRQLLNFLYEIPKKSIMHDMWLALIAATFGKIGFLNESTLLYRQHSNNFVGAKDVNSLKYFIDMATSKNEIHKKLKDQYKQADEFLEMYFNVIDKTKRRMLCEYASLDNVNMFYRVISLVKYRIFKKGFYKRIAQVLYGVFC